MIGRVHNLFHSRDLFEDHRLDAMLQGHINHPTTLTSPTEADIGCIFFVVKQCDKATMSSEPRIDF